MRANEVYIVTGVSIFALIVLTLVSYSQPKPNLVSFGDSPFISIFDGKLNLIIGNDNSSSEKVLRIYAIHDTSNIILSATDLADPISGQIIPSKSVGFPDKPSVEIKNITETNPQNVKLHVDYGNIPPGIYRGTITAAGQNNTSIPFTFDLRPNLGQIIMLVVDGIAISILSWKFIIYHNHKAINSRIIKRKDELVAGTGIPNPIPNPTLKDIANNPNANLSISFKDYLRSKPTYDLHNPLTFKKYVENAATNEKAKNEAVQIVGTILFGVGVSVLGLFNNSYITSIHNISYLDVFALIGIGLGIGSLKDFAAQLNRLGSSL